MATLSEKTLKMLWGRAGGRCSHPECRKDLFIDEEEATIPTLVGENCHMAAENGGGLRFDLSMSPTDRNAYSNLILLCRNHHKQIDDTTNGESNYPVEHLQQMKVDHETWVRGQLGFDDARQFAEEQWAGIVDRWELLTNLSRWLAWSSHVLGSGQPMMRKDVGDGLDQACSWLLARVWPDRYPTLKKAFKNYWEVLQDFRMVFYKYAELQNDEVWITRKFYQIDRWDDELYSKLARQYDWQVDLISDLMLELTRAANLICDEVRKNVDRRYRLKEGVLMVQRGPNSDLSYVDFPVFYNDEEKALEVPYPGLDKYIEIRTSRDVSIGQGPKPD